jgi:hypothetical protein
MTLPLEASHNWHAHTVDDWVAQCHHHGVPFRVLFLDLDGVCNSEAWYHRRPWERCWFDPVAVARVSALALQADAAVVISSSWRTGQDTEWLRGFLYAYGFDAPIIDQTPIIREAGRQRGDEIQQWLDEHPGVDHFVILDDGSDMAHLLPHLVQSTWAQGFLEEHALAALRVLGVTPTATPQQPVPEVPDELG